MPGTFDTLFDDDAPQGFFGGYRPQYQSVLEKLAGASNSGQTPPVTDTSVASGPNNDATPSVMAYPNGSSVRDPSGHPYLRPPGFDMQRNFSIVDRFNEASLGSSDDLANTSSAFDVGPTNHDAMFAALFLPGTDMDYQRPNGFFGSKEMEYRPIGYYNYGVMAARAGYRRDEALQNAGIYNRYFGGPYFGANGVNILLGQPPKISNRYGLNGDDAENFIGQGYDDYMKGRWTSDPSK